MIVTKYTQGGGSGSGSTVAWSQTLTAGTEIAQITINGASTTVYAPSAETTPTKTVYVLNEMSQAELAAMYAEITALPSASTNYNELYDFYYFKDWNGGGMYRGWKMQGGYLDGDGKMCFSAITIKENDISQIYFFWAKVSSDGTLSDQFTEYHLS